MFFFRTAFTITKTKTKTKKKEKHNHMSGLRRTRKAPDRLTQPKVVKAKTPKPTPKSTTKATSNKGKRRTKKQAAEESEESQDEESEWEDWDSDEAEKEGSKKKRRLTSAEILEQELTQLNSDEYNEYIAKVLDEYSDVEDAPVNERRDIMLGVLFKHMHFEKQVDHRCAIHAFNHVLQKGCLCGAGQQTGKSA